MTSYLRYKAQIAICDADDDIESWITVRGNHIPIKKGQSKEEAVKSFIEHQAGKNDLPQGTKWSPTNTKGEGTGNKPSQKKEKYNIQHGAKISDIEGMINAHADKKAYKSWKEEEEYVAEKLKEEGIYAYGNQIKEAMKNVYGDTYTKERKEESKYDPDFEVVRKNALANGNVYGGKYTQKSKAEAYKEYKKDTESSKSESKPDKAYNTKGLYQDALNELDDQIADKQKELENIHLSMTENAEGGYFDIASANMEDIEFVKGQLKELKKKREKLVGSQQATGSLRSKFSQKYDELYKDSKKDAKYNYLVKDFDLRMKDDPQFKKQVQEFVKERGDVLSSDREVKAYMLAAEESGILKKRNSVSGLKESDGKIEFTRTTPSLKDITVKADSNGVTINGKHYKVEYDPSHHWKARKDGNVIKTNAKNPVEFAKRSADTDDANLGNLFLEGLTKKSATDSWKSLFDSADTKKRWSADWKK